MYTCNVYNITCTMYMILCIHVHVHTCTMYAVYCNNLHCVQHVYMYMHINHVHVHVVGITILHVGEKLIVNHCTVIPIGPYVHKDGVHHITIHVQCKCTCCMYSIILITQPHTSNDATVCFIVQYYSLFLSH